MDETERSRDTPTDLAPPPSSDDGPITQPPGKLETMLPGKPPLSLEDSYLDRAIRVVAEAGEDIRRGRDEARRQHIEVLDEIRRSDANQTRNYEMVRNEIRQLKDSDATQNSSLASLTERMGAMERLVETSQLSVEFQDQFRDMQAALASFVDAVGSTSRLAGKKVLCVDDQPLILKAIVRTLSAHGATVITADTFDAVRLLVETLHPDCATVDVKLGGGEDGTEIARWLIQVAGMAPSQVMLVTGAEGPRSQAVAAELGIQVLIKPIANADLVEAIREAVSSSRGN